MKKIIVGFVLVILLLSVAGIGIVTASKPNNNGQLNRFSLPENAVEVSPGVYYLGKSMNNKKVVDDYLFVHYAKGSGSDKKGGKPVADSGCYSFISNDMEWKVKPTYSINPNYASMSGYDIVTEINDATYEWDNHGLDVFGSYSGTTSAGFGIGTDGQNTLSFGDYTTPGVIAVTRVSGVFGGRPKNRQILEFDIMFDKDFEWSDCTADGVDCTTKMDLQNIATHELGHAIGLGDLYTDSCDVQTMYGYSWNGDISRRTLDVGDIAGLNILY